MTFTEKVGRHFKSRLVRFHFIAGDQFIGKVGECGEDWIQMTGEDGKETFVNPRNVICVELEEEG